MLAKQQRQFNPQFPRSSIQSWCVHDTDHNLFCAQFFLAAEEAKQKAQVHAESDQRGGRKLYFGLYYLASYCGVSSRRQSELNFE
jgi:hypothetical protein